LPKAPLDTALEDRFPAASVKITTAGGFLGVAGVREDRRAAREELREAVERVRELEALASRHSPLFGKWKPPEVAREVGKALLDKVVSYARFKGLSKGAEGELVKLSTAAGGGASAFNALNDVEVAKAAGEAASAIWRVVEEAEIAVRPAVAVASRALAEAGKRLAEGREWERLVDVGLADDEFRRAFNIAGDKRPLFFVYLVGDVEYGAVRARGVRAVAFVSGAKTLRIEVLAEGVEGLATERVKALGGEWVRLATFEIDVETGVIHLFLRVGSLRGWW